jgi:ligand-binding sensor domain-containing protein
MLGSAVGAIAAEQGRVCAAADLRRDPAERGVTCFAPDFSNFTYLSGGLAGIPGTQVRRMLLTRDAVWLATNAGALRIPRGGAAARQFTERDGLQSGDVRALARTSAGIWVGSGVGVAVAPEGDTRDPARPVALVAGSVLALAVTGDTLWIGSSLGLLVLPPGAGAPVPVLPELPALRSPVVALAVAGDTILAAFPTRLALRTGGAWRVVDPPGVSIGRFTAAAPDARGFWLGGAQGLAFYQPASNVWRALTSTGDLPLPVLDVAAAGDYVWVATPGGVVRLLRRVLVP